MESTEHRAQSTEHRAQSTEHRAQPEHAIDIISSSLNSASTDDLALLTVEPVSLTHPPLCALPCVAAVGGHHNSHCAGVHDPPIMFNLADDIGESNLLDLSTPAVAAALTEIRAALVRKNNRLPFSSFKSSCLEPVLANHRDRLGTGSGKERYSALSHYAV
jgi:hypothetical protein